jgi:DNA (cytosine-5)-methyltransferase 1
MGGFHRALTSLGHECVFVSEIDEELRELYKKNFPQSKNIVYGDIREFKSRVPKHDILCAGFPCQPFSKSGYQNGRRDRTRGTLFHEIVELLKEHRPSYVILENVGNFERHNMGRTWKIVQDSLTELDYDVRGTVHIRSGGQGLISPHHFGYPHTRERFFIVASLHELPTDPFPRGDRKRITSLADIIQPKSELTAQDRQETALTPSQTDCIKHWNKLLKRIPATMALPSFPIWGDEINAVYPFEGKTPHATPLRELRKLVGGNGVAHGVSAAKAAVLNLLPSYARTPETRFPEWKVDFIRQNRAWFSQIRPYFPPGWISELETFPPSLRKLEWYCKGEVRDLWEHVLQFRPSGLRAKRFTSAPALVAMTITQVPILGPKRRSLSRIEGLRLQGFPDSHQLPRSRSSAFAALGNAVHTGVVKAIAEQLLGAAHHRPRKGQVGTAHD